MKKRATLSSTHLLTGHTYASYMTEDVANSSVQFNPPSHWTYLCVHMTEDGAGSNVQLHPPSHWTYLCFRVTAAGAESGQCSAPQGRGTDLALWQ